MSRTDLYPSRTGSAARVLPRKDPVVEPGPPDAGAPLSARQIDAYERRGFLRLDTLFEAGLTERLAEEAGRLLVADHPASAVHVVREPSSREVRSIFAVHEEDGLFRDLTRHPLLARIARQILGGPVYIHQSRINFKPAFHGLPFHWHSDFETWHVEDGMPRMRAFSLSLGLTETRADNGPLMLIPESHRHFVSCPGRTPERHFERSLGRQEAGLPPESIVTELARTNDIESPTGPAGSATIFDCNLLHGSSGNITPFSRTNLFLVFNRLDNALECPFSGQGPRPPHIATRDPQPLP